MRCFVAQLGFLSFLGASTSSCRSIEAATPAGQPYFEASDSYDWGWHGSNPRQRYRSFGGASPKPNVAEYSHECGEGLVFVEPREPHKSKARATEPGPVILDSEGNLVWMPTQWVEMRDLKVQQSKNARYITFWTRRAEDRSEGYYVMLNESYEVVKEIRPVGSRGGKLQDLFVTDDNTAIITMYREVKVPGTIAEPSTRPVYENVFQEIDLNSGHLLFEWPAAHRFSVKESTLQGQSKAGLPVFTINSVDKNAEGNYLVTSSRLFDGVACVAGADGHVLWQLGGKRNAFQDLSDGAATRLSLDCRASWSWNSTTLVVHDDGRQLLIQLDLDQMTAALVHISSTVRLPPSTSLSSVQILPNENVLVGWSNLPGFSEFAKDGRRLCSTHLGAVRLPALSLAATYRVSKFEWVGRPSSEPAVAVRHGRNGPSLYVSWNGDTEVSIWELQSGPHPDGDVFVHHFSVARRGFETRIPLPAQTEAYVRVLALDRRRQCIGRSRMVWRHVESATWWTPVLASWNTMRCRRSAMSWAAGGGGLFMGVAIAYRYRTIRRRRLSMLRRGKPACEYQGLSSNDKLGVETT